MNLAKVKEKKTRTLNYRQPLTKKQSLHMDVILLLSRSVPSLRLTIIFFKLISSTTTIPYKLLSSIITATPTIATLLSLPRFPRTILVFSQFNNNYLSPSLIPHDNSNCHHSHTTQLEQTPVTINPTTSNPNPYKNRPNLASK